ncbi:MAG: DUF642 domain-containing protein [Burkholderiales bacterium]|nr:DUF642 domain-containing protein [Burkholderiales bacterium]
MKTLPKFLLCMALAFSGNAQANLIVNGSFENPVIAAGTFVPYANGSTAITGWTVASGYYTDIISNGFWTTTTPYGSQYLYLNDSGRADAAIWQDVALASGANYSLSFALNGLGNSGSSVSVSLTGAASSGFATRTASSISNWTQFSYNFTPAASGSYRLTFSSPAGGYVMLDNVQINSAVPEPETLALLFAGFMAIGFKRKIVT